MKYRLRGTSPYTGRRGFVTKRTYRKKATALKDKKRFGRKKAFPTWSNLRIVKVK